VSAKQQADWSRTVADHTLVSGVPQSGATLDRLMKNDAVEIRTERRLLVEAVAASTIGTTIEWYDFFLYGIVAADVFPELFFPGAGPLKGRVLSLLTFTAGFLTRPVGGALFGYLGDRVGRKSTLVATLLLMGVSTVLVGCLPTYATLGVTASILLVLLRAIQGIGVGGEWGGAVLLALEYGHRGKRGFYASWPQAGVPLGLLSAAGVVYLCQRFLGRADFVAWGWRIPFFLSALLILIGLLIRMRILETPLFRQLQDRKELAHAPVSEAVRRHWREILLAAGARLSENSCFYLFSVSIIDYGKNVLQVETQWVMLAVNVAAAVEFFTIPLYGLLSDRLSRRRVYVLGSLFLIVFALPYYALLETRQPGWIALAVVLSLAGGHALLYSVQASLIPELFGTRLRYSGASIGYQLAAPLAGGASPLIALALAERFPGQSWPLAEYIIVISVVSLLCVIALEETSRRDLSQGA
jgi:metabolite-proton symporter